MRGELFISLGISEPDVVLNVGISGPGVILKAVQEAPDDLDSNNYFLLRQTIATLPDDFKEPFLLQVIGGYSSTEIAEMLNLKPGAVMTRVFRARQKLREILSENPVNSEVSN